MDLGAVVEMLTGRAGRQITHAAKILAQFCVRAFPPWRPKGQKSVLSQLVW